MTEYADTDYYLVADGGSEIKAAKPGKEEKTVKSRTNIPGPIFRGSMNYQVKGAKWGIIDRQGREVIEVDYDEISYPINGVIYVCKGGKFGFYDLGMKLVVKPIYTHIGLFNRDGICWVKIGGKTAKAAAKGVASFFSLSSTLSSAKSSFTLLGGKMGIIDRQGRPILPVKYKYVGTFKETKDELFSSEKAAEYDVVPFSELPSWGDETYIWYGNKLAKDVCVADVQGRRVVPEKRYSLVFKPTDGMMRFYMKGKKKKESGVWGFYDLNSRKEFITDNKYAYGPFHQGLSKVTSDEDCFFVDKQMKEVSAHYDNADCFSEGYCVVMKDDKYGAIDISGKETIPLEYDKMSSRFSEGLVAAAKASRDTVNTAAGPRIPSLDRTVPGLMSHRENRVSSNEKGFKYGFIDATNRVVIPFEYDKVGDFENDRVWVFKGDSIGIINKSNQIIMPIRWKDIKYPTEAGLLSSYFWVKDADNLFYYYDMEKNEVLFPSASEGYMKVEYFNENGYAVVKRGGMSETGYGAVRRDGTLIIPCSFDEPEVSQAYLYLLKNKLEKFRDVDVMRFRIFLSGDSNRHKLSETITSTDWDF